MLMIYLLDSWKLQRRGDIIGELPCDIPDDVYMLNNAMIIMRLNV